MPYDTHNQSSLPPRSHTKRTFASTDISLSPPSRQQRSIVATHQAHAHACNTRRLRDHLRAAWNCISLSLPLSIAHLAVVVGACFELEEHRRQGCKIGIGFSIELTVGDAGCRDVVVRAQSLEDLEVALQVRVASYLVREDVQRVRFQEQELLEVSLFCCFHHRSGCIVFHPTIQWSSRYWSTWDRVDLAHNSSRAALEPALVKKLDDIEAIIGRCAAHRQFCEPS